MKRLPEFPQENASFQIAPLVDVVFVILVFFMALAAQIKIEQVLATQLPGAAVADAPVSFFDEQIIAISSDGVVTLNDEEFDTPNSRNMPQLYATLVRLVKSSENAKTRLVVTIVSDEDSLYYRTIDVLNAISAAGVKNVSLTVSAEY